MGGVTLNPNDILTVLKQFGIPLVGQADANIVLATNSNTDSLDVVNDAAQMASTIGGFGDNKTLGWQLSNFAASETAFATGFCVAYRDFNIFRNDLNNSLPTTLHDGGVFLADTATLFGDGISMAGAYESLSHPPNG